MSEEIRHRILAAAARVYAQYGFRGATTRLIATEADVNEVTLFSTFGSKAQLLQEMLQSHVGSGAAPTLSADVGDPEGAMTAWCAATLEYLRNHAQVIRKTIAEAEERPVPRPSPHLCPRPPVLALAHPRPHTPLVAPS